MKKIKIIKDIPGFKAGETVEATPNGLSIVADEICGWYEYNIKPLIRDSYAFYVDEPEEVKFNGGPFPIQLPEKIVDNNQCGSVQTVNALIDYLKAREELTDKK